MTAREDMLALADRELLVVLGRVTAAVQANDLDTLGQYARDDKILWVGEGSWGERGEVTLGDLRAISAWNIRLQAALRARANTGDAS